MPFFTRDLSTCDNPSRCSRSPVYFSPWNHVHIKLVDPSITKIPSCLLEYLPAPLLLRKILIWSLDCLYLLETYKWNHPFISLCGFLCSAQLLMLCDSLMLWCASIVFIAECSLIVWVYAIFKTFYLLVNIFVFPTFWLLPLNWLWTSVWRNLYGQT